MKQIQKDILKGFILGALFPVLIFLIMWMIFKLSYGVNIPYDVQPKLLLFSMGANFMVALRTFRKKREFVGRGIMLSIMPYAIYWVAKFLIE